MLQTCFKEKFGIPRQPGLVAAAQGVIKLQDHPFFKTAVQGLEGFSHLWVLFLFHRRDAKNWKPSIRPPRLGGNRKIGVLASRSPHRPNPIGLSAVRLIRVDPDAPGGPELHVGGVDVLDGSPVLDVKPYLPYADAIPEATSGWASERIARTPVLFSPLAEEQLQALASAEPELRQLIVGLLELDPRPAFQKRRMPPGSLEAEGTQYGFRILDYDVKWQIEGTQFRVTELVQES